mgnify:CR=1 FL=1
MLIAGLDIGTTGCKISVFKKTGELLGQVYSEYPVTRTHNEHEVDGGAIWEATKQIIRQAAQRYGSIGGIGVTSFGEAFVMLDEADEPLHSAMLYTDPRGQEECAALIEELGADKIIGITGLNPHSMYSLPKLMWIKKHKPVIFARARRVCLMEDYIVYLLSGKAQIDYSLASRTMAFDIHSLTWSKEILQAAEIDIELLPVPVPAGTSAGKIRRALAFELGVSEDAEIVSVSHDQVAAAIGSGVFDKSVAVDGAGTVECITPVFSDLRSIGLMAQGNYSIVPYIIPGTYVCYAFSFTGGALVKWFIDNLAGYAAQQAERKEISIYRELEDNWRHTPTGLLVLPHFAGAATPYMDAGSKGAIVGLTLANTQHDIFLAIMEGVCYEMLLNIRQLEKAGITIQRLHATGGGAKSRVWMQMKADILNVPITALRSVEAGATGSAMLVGIATGVFTDLNDAAKSMVIPKETFYPRKEIHDEYMKHYERYEKLYNAIRPLV